MPSNPADAPAPPLRATANYSSAHSYVLKLHCDAQPGRGRLIGRLEHIATGDRVDFADAAELLAWLAHHHAGLPSAAAPGDGLGRRATPDPRPDP